MDECGFVCDEQWMNGPLVVLVVLIVFSETQ